jgi:hypothetical protein
MFSSKVSYFLLSVLLLFGANVYTINHAVADDDGNGRIYKLTDVKGRYGFSFQGEVIGVGPIAAVGTIKADGKGNIPEAVRTVNFLGSTNTQTFRCIYIINPDGTGSAKCPVDIPLPGFPLEETFDYVIEENGKAFRIVGTTPGVVVIGDGHK